MSAGRTTPATVSWRSSKFTRTSCDPLISRFPFGSTWVTTAGTENWICSERSMLPAPWLVEVELKSLLKVRGVGVVLEEPELWGLNSQSKAKFVFAAVERPVELPNVALSLIEMTTVTMSPTLAMRWSVYRLTALGIGPPSIWSGESGFRIVGLRAPDRCRPPKARAGA